MNKGKFEHKSINLKKELARMQLIEKFREGDITLTLHEGDDFDIFFAEAEDGDVGLLSSNFEPIVPIIYDDITMVEVDEDCTIAFCKICELYDVYSVPEGIVLDRQVDLDSDSDSD